MSGYLAGNKRKPSYGFWFALFFIALYVGYCLGKIEQITLDNITDKIKESLLNPLPIVETDLTVTTMAIAALVWFIAFIHYLTKVKTFLPGQEYGTARFSPWGKITKKLADKDATKNKILSEHLRVSTNDYKTMLNNNVLIIGGSGAGKTLFYVTPNVYQALGSYIYTDPDGGILRQNKKRLEDDGFIVKVLNLIGEGMKTSYGYNPFVYLKSDTDVIKLITNLIANTTPKEGTKGDPFWEKAEGELLQALFYYTWKECPIERRNFRTVMELLNMAEVPEDLFEESQLDKLMYVLDEKHPALIAYKHIRKNSPDTIRNIIGCLNARLAYLQNEDILRILDKDEMDLSFIGRGYFHDGKTKTALFCVIPDNDKSYNFVVGMLYTQLFQDLYYQADFRCGGRLPIPVMFWMDEFANSVTRSTVKAVGITDKAVA